MAGGGRARRFWEHAALACQQQGQTLEVVWTARPGDAASAAAAARDRLVVAVGGDGTANEVVNGLLTGRQTTPPRFGALLRGTGSDLVRTLPSPRLPGQVPAWLNGRRWRAIDVGRVEMPLGRRYFVNVADAGIGAEVARRAARGPALMGGTLRFLAAAVFSLLVHRNALVSIRLDEGTVESVLARSVVLANGRYFGGGMCVAPQAQPDDGYLDLVLIGDLGRLQGIWRLPLLYQGKHGRLPQVRFALVRRVEIRSTEPVGIEADGELVGGTPAVFEVVPGALEVLAWNDTSPQ